MRKSLTDREVAAKKPTGKRQVISVPQQSNLYLRIQPKGAKSYWMMARNPSGDPVWSFVGSADVMKITEACERTRGKIQRIRDGLPAVERQADSLSVVAAEWMKRHVLRKGLRTGGEYQRILDRYILPAWSDREFIAIRRSDVTSLLDKVEDRHGPRQADYCLATVRAIGNWYESRHDDYRSPVSKNMKRVSAKATARSRILNDDELRKLWAAANLCGAFGAIVKFALLTGQRLQKVAEVKWADIVDGVWVIDTDEREKGNAGELALPEMTLAIVRAQPKIGDSPYVFAGRGPRPFSGFSKSKTSVDRLSGVTDWTLHDLRRTARSLMSRAGVISDHAERVLGHAIGGVQEVYDRHAYFDEKRIALAKLATLVESIVNRHDDNVVPLDRRERAQTQA